MTINTERDYDAALGQLVRNAMDEARKTGYSVENPTAHINLKFTRISS